MGAVLATALRHAISATSRAIRALAQTAIAIATAIVAVAVAAKNIIGGAAGTITGAPKTPINLTGLVRVGHVCSIHGSIIQKTRLGPILNQLY